MLNWDGDLKLEHTNLFLDARQPRELSFISHAHSDHICLHTHTLATKQTAAFCRHRLGDHFCTALDYHRVLLPDPDTRLLMTPAGHCLGSAMLHITRPEGTLLYTGDFRPGPSLTCPPAEPLPADHLLMECTFGLPIFRFPPRQQVIDQLLSLVASAFKDGRQPIVLGYSLGKSQELCRILTSGGFNVTFHGAPYALGQIYQEQGVSLGDFRRYAYEDFHGASAIDLHQRGALVAPPHVARTAFVKRFDNPVTIMATGWGLLKDARYRYGVDHVLPLSDHADFDELLQTIERVAPKRILLHHGYTEAFRDHLLQLGLKADIARPPAQMQLFA